MTKQSLLILLILLFGCQKTKFETRPRLKLVSVSSVNIKDQENLQLIIQITDKQGDFIDTAWVTKVATFCPFDSYRKPFILSETEGAIQRKNNFLGEYIFSLTYLEDLQPSGDCNQADTAVFYIWTKDKKGNFSDTVKTSPIFIDFQ
jgi:hypothetical protein